MTETPKSYLTDAEREALIRERPQNVIYLLESRAADEAGDSETAWEWLSYADLPAYALKALKEIAGADFVRQRNFKSIIEADQVYGKNWLNA
jgi:hypothetical protein